MRFVTEVYHPNVFVDGTLCLDIIQDKWKPIYTVSTILTSIQVRGGWWSWGGWVVGVGWW